MTNIKMNLRRPKWAMMTAATRDWGSWYLTPWPLDYLYETKYRPNINFFDFS